MTVILDEDQIEFLKKDFKKHVFFPRETKVKRRPAVEWRSMSGEPPLIRTRIIVGENGEFARESFASARVQSIVWKIPVDMFRALLRTRPGGQAGEKQKGERPHSWRLRGPATAVQTTSPDPS